MYHVFIIDLHITLYGNTVRETDVFYYTTIITYVNMQTHKICKLIRLVYLY